MSRSMSECRTKTPKLSVLRQVLRQTLQAFGLSGLLFGGFVTATGIDAGLRGVGRESESPAPAVQRTQPVSNEARRAGPILTPLGHAKFEAVRPVPVSSSVTLNMNELGVRLRTAEDEDLASLGALGFSAGWRVTNVVAGEEDFQQGDLLASRCATAAPLRSLAPNCLVVVREGQAIIP